MESSSDTIRMVIEMVGPSGPSARKDTAESGPIERQESYFSVNLALFFNATSPVFLGTGVFD
jgi:hypothetical protein